MIFRTPSVSRAIARVTLASQLIWLLPSPAYATPLAIPDYPLFTAASAPPIVMIDSSRDHQLFYKAYNDYSDLNGDGAPETTYLHSFDYYGYFDSYKCYDYVVSSARFEPKSATTTKYCSGNWSGNFLNWVSMSRADVLRKVLFGGTRSTDTATDTVLERAHLPGDAHSWAKFYNGSDLSSLTPFPSSTTTTKVVTIGSSSLSGTSFAMPYNDNKFAFNGDQLKLTVGTSTYYGIVAAEGTNPTVNFRDSITIPASSKVTTENLSRAGVSFCNTTQDTANTSQTTTQPPVLRVARGNYMLWGANEKWQCKWFSEKSRTQNSLGSNGNRYGAGAGLLVSELAAAGENPNYNNVGLAVSGMATPDYTVRVKVCVSGLIGTENCKLYDSAYKPVGLLQKYGEGATPRLYFGFMTPSFTKNVSGGVLRKNTNVSLSGNTTAALDEINPSTGQFTGIDGIIKSMANLRIYGYDYTNGVYLGSGGDSCDYQQIGIAPTGSGITTGGSGYAAAEGNCTSWGNPMSEVYVESLRYLAGKTSTSAFSYAHSGSKDQKAGLTTPQTWVDPLNSTNYCSPLNILLFNASVSSYDSDQAESAFTSGTGWSSLSGYTDQVGAGEGIPGNYFIGNSGTVNNGVCSSKTISNLSAANGICPEAPSLKGSYGMAGAAYFAHTNPIRSSLGPSGDTTPYKVTTYGVSLATSVPRISIPVGDKRVVIQPAYQLDRTDKGAGNYGTGTIVDFRIVKQDAASGKFYINWEDSNQGGDYDQDVIGILSYSVSGSNITVTTQVIAASTANPQGFGYVISGTDKDGPHFHSGILKYSYTDPKPVTVTPATNINASGGCNVCDDSLSTPAARSVTYSVASGSAGGVLQDPLYYAAKWGGFNTKVEATPATPASYDIKNNTTGASGADGQPDNFYYVNNPGTLEASLDKAFRDIASASAASAVAANSTSLRTGTVLYQAIFNPSNWTGDLIAYSVNSTTGDLTKAWQASTYMTSSTFDWDGRAVITSHSSTRSGVPFRWTNISSAQQSQIQASDTAAIAQNRLNYIRGDATYEGSAPTQFRSRGSRLGDIVDSDPVYVGAATGQYNDVGRFAAAYYNASYMSWRSARANRTPMIYVGANDGMLHGFVAASTSTDTTPPGKEKFAFVPSQAYTNLASLSSQAYQENHRYFVNGSPSVADAYFSSGTPTWKTVLVSGLRKGGKGVFALDVTEPANFVESKASQLLLWDFLDSDDSAGDLGYIYGKPIIAKMANGKWAAIFGNGYNSTSEKAVLFILFLDHAGTSWTAGSDYIKLVAESTGSNGLAAPAAFDKDLDGTVDSLYAGDLKGNMWKFDVSNVDPTKWGSSLLAVACTDNTDPCPAAKRRPITTTPNLTFNPVDTNTPIVYFGSGKYLEKSDTTSTAVESMYGVWDKGLTTKRSQYLVQTITGSGGRTVTKIPQDWATYMGWVEDLPATGERQIATPTVFYGTVFYNTFIPSTSICEFGGSGYLMSVLYDNGGGAAAIERTPGVKDSVDGLAIGGALGGTSVIIAPEGDAPAYGYSSTTKPADPTDPKPRKDRLYPPGQLGTRLGWRELLQR